ncbi:MAG: hypothetical protein K8L91_17115 [Anaerolineae bacterium]|nr:hypothetical protein [Anaerolineae bacterium]
MDRTRLQEAFDFTAEDLEANRNGLLSEGQMENGLSSARRLLVGTTAGLALFLGAAVVYAWIDVNFRSAAFLGILSIWAVWGCWRTLYKVYKDGVEEIALIDKGELKCLDYFNKRNVVNFDDDKPLQKAIPVEGAKLYLLDEEFAVLDNGTYYRVFYWYWLDKEHTPRGYILSIEPLD